MSAPKKVLTVRPSLIAPHHIAGINKIIPIIKPHVMREAIPSIANPEKFSVLNIYLNGFLSFQLSGSIAVLSIIIFFLFFSFRHSFINQRDRITVP